MNTKIWFDKNFSLGSFPAHSLTLDKDGNPRMSLPTECITLRTKEKFNERKNCGREDGARADHSRALGDSQGVDCG